MRQVAGLSVVRPYCLVRQVERLQRQAEDLKGDKEDLLRDVSRLKDAAEAMRASCARLKNPVLHACMR
jgi:hypothetical protein